MNLAFCFALLLGLAAVTPGEAEDYYIYQAPNGELVISNKQPPPGSKIIKQQNLPEAVTSPRTPQAAAKRPDKRLAEAVQQQIERVSTQAYYNSFKPVADCILGLN